MAASVGTLTIPVYVKVGGKEIELGALELDVKVGPGGRVKTPPASEIKRALRKGLR